MITGDIEEFWTENPCVGGSIPPLATAISKGLGLYIIY